MLFLRRSTCLRLKIDKKRELCRGCFCALISRYRTIRTTTKPFTAECNIDIYSRFPVAEPKDGDLCRLAELLEDLLDDSGNEPESAVG